MGDKRDGCNGWVETVKRMKEQVRRVERGVVIGGRGWRDGWRRSGLVGGKMDVGERWMWRCRMGDTGVEWLEESVRHWRAKTLYLCVFEAFLEFKNYKNTIQVL